MALAMCTFVAVSMAACSDDDDDEGRPQEPVADNFDGSSIVGRWQLVSIMTDSSDVNTGEHSVYETTGESDEGYRQFNANGTVKMIFQSGGSLDGTYTYDEGSHALVMTIMDDVERGTVTTLTASELSYYAVYQNTSHTVLVDTMKYVRVQ